MMCVCVCMHACTYVRKEILKIDVFCCSEFTSLFMRGYLAIRLVSCIILCHIICYIPILVLAVTFTHVLVTTVVKLMLDTGFPCFRKNPIEELAVQFILDRINSAYLNIR